MKFRIRKNNNEKFQRVLQVRRKYCSIILWLLNACEKTRREEESRWLEGDERRDMGMIGDNTTIVTEIPIQSTFTDIQ